MKKAMLLVFVLLSFALGTDAAVKPLGVEEFGSIEEVANEIISYFPRVQAEVKAVESDRLTIALGTKDGLQPGTELSLWRDGKEIHHPVTGAVIGRMEDEVGTVEVVTAADATCTAVIRKRVLDPRAGDKARITPKKISLALLPVRADHPEMMKDLAQRLIDSGRFQLIDEDRMTALLREKKQRDSTLIREIGKAFNPDVIAAVGLYPAEGEKIFVTARLYYSDEARQLDTIVALLNLKAAKKVFGEMKPFFAPAGEEKNSVPDLPFDAQLFAYADIDGSGKISYIFSDGVRLHIYQHTAAGWRETWAETKPKDPAEIQHLNLDVADINGDGVPELFVTEMVRDKVVSYVLEYRSGLYERIAELPGFLRVVKNGQSHVLLGQDYDPRTFYAGAPHEMVWTDGKYTSGADFALPPGVGLYGWTYAETGEARPLLVALDSMNHLVVYSGDSPVWKSEEVYPTVGITVSKPTTGIDASLTRSDVEDRSLRVKVPGRILALDLNGDGREEVVLAKNMGGNFPGEYTKAEVVSLGWTGVRLDQRWNIKDVPGAVLDLRIMKDAASAQVLTLVKLPGGLFAKDKYRVSSFTAK